MVDTEKYFKQKLYGLEGNIRRGGIIDLNGVVKVKSRLHQLFFNAHHIFYFRI